ncbi:hypothetical protein P4O66_015198, partial [Electrophorus voltai]
MDSILWCFLFVLAPAHPDDEDNDNNEASRGRTSKDRGSCRRGGPTPAPAPAPGPASDGNGADPRSTVQAAEAPAETLTVSRTSLAGPGLRAGGGLLNTARFRWRNPEEGARFTEQVPIIWEVLFDCFGLHPGALICAQRNGGQHYFDVTMASDAAYRRVLELEEKLRDHPLGKYYVLEPLWDGDRQMVTIHFFNHHVSAAEVRQFMARYGDVLPGECMVRDELGIWNGCRQLLMTFKKDNNGDELLGAGAPGQRLQEPSLVQGMRGGGTFGALLPRTGKILCHSIGRGRECGPERQEVRGEELESVEEITPPEQVEEDLPPPAALMTSSQAEARTPALSQTPRPSEAFFPKVEE